MKSLTNCADSTIQRFNGSTAQRLRRAGYLEIHKPGRDSPTLQVWTVVIRTQSRSIALNRVQSRLLKVKKIPCSAFVHLSRRSMLFYSLIATIVCKS
jgi:hypothetical protein